MGKTKFDKRFFESTRGQIVLLLHGTTKTVNELATTLDLSDNAIRAHLLTLERDGLVEQGGQVKGFRKPHFVYKLTSDARGLFPSSYDMLFNRLIDVLKTKLHTNTVKETLKDVGRTLGEEQAIDGDLDERIEKTIEVLHELGGAAKVVHRNGRTVIASESCPFAESVVEHCEVCQIAESMLTEMLGRPVHEKCDRTHFPKCCFEIETT